MSRLVVAVIVLLSTVFGLLGTAVWNRGGTPQFITLTERELALPWTWTNERDDDDAELRLRFEWEHRADDPRDARAWLTDSRLADIGFSLLVPAGAADAARFYNRMLPRLAWAAFELDGPAWRAIAQRRLVTAADDPRRVDPSASRLVPIDVAPGAATLRHRYEGQAVVVMPVVVEVRHDDRPGQGPMVWGQIVRLVAETVSVPPRLRSRLAGLGQPPRSIPAEWKPGDTIPEPPAPRYDVDLGVGRLGAPWIQDVRRMP